MHALVTFEWIQQKYCKTKLACSIHLLGSVFLLYLIGREFANLIVEWFMFFLFFYSLQLPSSLFIFFSVLNILLLYVGAHVKGWCKATISSNPEKSSLWKLNIFQCTEDWWSNRSFTGTNYSRHQQTRGSSQLNQYFMSSMLQGTRNLIIVNLFICIVGSFFSTCSKGVLTLRRA